MNAMRSNKLRALVHVFVLVTAFSGGTISATPTTSASPPSVFKLEVSPEHQPRPDWLTLFDILAWPAIVVIGIITLRRPAANLIEAFATRGADFSVAGIAIRLPAIESKIANQQGQLDVQNEQIRQLITFSMAWYIYRMLYDLNSAGGSGGQYIYRNDGSMDRNIRFLIDHGYIQEVYPFPSDGQNIAQLIKLTDMGKSLISIRGKP